MVGSSQVEISDFSKNSKFSKGDKITLKVCFRPQGNTWACFLIYKSRFFLERFHNNSSTLSKITVFRFLPVFHKKTGKFYSRFETYFSSCTHVCNLITIPPFYQKYQFFGFLPVFHKNTGKFYLRFETYSSSCTYVCNFITIAPLYQKYRFFGFLPVFHENTGKSDFEFGTYVESYIYPEIFIEIGPFFNLGPQPGRTLAIGKAWNKSNNLEEFFLVHYFHDVKKKNVSGIIRCLFKNCLRSVFF